MGKIDTTLNCRTIICLGLTTEYIIGRHTDVGGQFRLGQTADTECAHSQ